MFCSFLLFLNYSFILFDSFLERLGVTKKSALFKIRKCFWLGAGRFTSPFRPAQETNWPKLFHENHFLIKFLSSWLICLLFVSSGLGQWLHGTVLLVALVLFISFLTLFHKTGTGGRKEWWARMYLFCLYQLAKTCQVDIFFSHFYLEPSNK